MKFKRTDHWTNKSNQEGLLFFAQILDEALFDFTLDTFKPKALNLRLLCIEALQTIDNIKKGIIKRPNLKSIIEELLWIINGDAVARIIFDNKLVVIVDKIKANENNLTELKAVIVHLYHQLDQRKYLEKIKELLIDLVPINKEKEKIYCLSKIYLTELINYGYLPGFIYYQVNLHFFNRNNSVTETTPKEFFELFNFTTQKFKIIFRTDEVLKDFKVISKNLNFTIRKTLNIPNLTSTAKSFIKNKPSNEVFFIFDDVEATNEVAARYYAELPLERIANLFSFYHHKEKPSINKNALVIDKNNNFLLLEKPIKSIIKKEDIKPQEAIKKVKDIFETVDLPIDTIIRITKAIDIHSIALETDEIENKLLNLWTAIETSIPKDVDCNQDRIIQIMKGLMPFQCVQYIQQIIKQTIDDFYYYNKRLSTEIFKTVLTSQAENRWNTVLALISTKENESIRNNIYAQLNDFPLLRYRIFSINKFFQTGKQLKKKIKDHTQNVEWQIQRIYRIRNLIVHSGEMPSYGNILVENIHNYFDNLINYVIDNAKEKNIKSIKEGIIACELEFENFMNNISLIGDNEINLSNYKSIN